MNPTNPVYKTMDLTIKRTIQAAPAEVYDAWLNPRHPGGPWHGANEVIFEPKVGNLFYFLRISDDSRRLPHYGSFAELDRPHKARLTWMSLHTKGLESMVTVTFEAKGEDTLLTLTHANLPDDEVGAVHEKGWTWLLGELAGQFTAKQS